MLAKERSLPSWSWASVSRAVYYKIPAYSTIIDGYINREINVLGYDIVTNGSPYMGDVQRAEIRISAPLLPMTMKWNGESPAPSYAQYDVEITQQKCAILYPDSVYFSNEFISDAKDKLRAVIFFTEYWSDDEDYTLIKRPYSPSCG